MKIELKIPTLGESISQVTIGAILKPSGSEVRIDDELLEMETDKLNQILYAPESGVVTYSVKPGDVIAVGQVIGFLESGKVEATAPIKIKEVVPEPRPQAKEAISEPEPLPTVSSRGETRKKLSTLRKTLAQRLLTAQKESVTVTTFNEVDMSEVVQFREKYREPFQAKYGVKLGLMSFFVKAALSALQAFPFVNAYLEGDEMVYRNYFDIAVAVSTDRGVIVPVIKNCETLSFADIEKQIGEFAERARSGRLTTQDLEGGGFTITNGGTFGSLLSTPVLNPPQCAILGMHKMTKRPCVVDDQIVIRPMMYLALSYDHRILDGKEAVQFLVHIKNCIEEPFRLELGL